MSRFHLAAAGGLAAVLACAGTAGAQNMINGMGGGSRNGGQTNLPYNQGPSAYPVAPMAPGSGGTYGYVQQNLGGRGASPDAYYSMNYFTNTPMTPPANVAPNRGYVYPNAGMATAPAPGATTYSSGYSAAPVYSNPYANANATYYQTRRGGPLRRVFGRR